jgi:hypothetical protein
MREDYKTIVNFDGQEIQIEGWRRTDMLRDDKLDVAYENLRRMTGDLAERFFTDTISKTDLLEYYKTLRRGLRLASRKFRHQQKTRRYNEFFRLGGELMDEIHDVYIKLWRKPHAL